MRGVEVWFIKGNKESRKMLTLSAPTLRKNCYPTLPNTHTRAHTHTHTHISITDAAAL